MVLHTGHRVPVVTFWAARRAAAVDGEADVALVRRAGIEIGLLDQQWAYVEDGKLPAKFDGGARVPARYHREVADADA